MLKKKPTNLPLPVAGNGDALQRILATAPNAQAASPKSVERPVAMLMDCDLQVPRSFGVNEQERLNLAHAAGVPCEFSTDGRPVRALIRFWISDDDDQARIAVSSEDRLRAATQTAALIEA